MGLRPGQGDGTGAEPIPGLPGGPGAPSDFGSSRNGEGTEGVARDPRLSGFAKDGEWPANWACCGPWSATTTSRSREAAITAGTWAITSNANDPGPPGGYGTWTITLPDDRQLTVRLEPVPALTGDHRHESHAYQPGDTLRHLVQVRDGTCTFPPCSRHARESDFEHAVPYDKGGRTCAGNAGARSRACHQVKQSPGWKVTQPRPGWHHWQTPAGRTYTQGPKHYPS
jgi:hypothetical protein